MSISDPERPRLTLGRILLAAVLVGALGAIFLAIVTVLPANPDRACLHGFSGPFGAATLNDVECSEVK
jgi:hypothetical protein